MPSDREHWDARHASQDCDNTQVPDALVVDAIEALKPPPTTAFDLAAGSGRHSLWLAGQGIVTEAWDVSPIGLALLSERAQATGLAVATREVDLSAALPSTRPRALVLVVNYLERTLFDSLHELVEPGGVAIVCTFTDDFPGQHPSARFRLRPGELQGLPGLTTERSEETGGRALLVARKPTA